MQRAIATDEHIEMIERAFKTKGAPPASVALVVVRHEAAFVDRIAQVFAA
jgi:hypothetical protein